jgi:hypothetical protein
LEGSFISNQAEESEKEIEKQINNLNIFGRPYIDIFVQQLSEELKNKPLNSSIEKLVKEMEPIINSTTEKFKSNSLKP